MKSFEALILEAVRSAELSSSDNKYRDWLKLSVKYMEKYKSSGILWRGFSPRANASQKQLVKYIALITNSKERKFRGSDYNWKPHEAVDAVISGVCDNTPVFCTYNLSRTKMFGSAYVVIPIPSFKTHVSKKIYDIGMITTDRKATAWSDSGLEIGWTNKKAEYSSEAIQNMIDSYTTATNSIVSPQGDSEILLDSKRYALLDVKKLIELNRSKFNKIKSIEQVKTYKDAIYVITNALSYLEWRDKNR